MKIKTKVILILNVIFISLGIVLNICIRQVVSVNMEDSIKSSLVDIMNSTREYIKYNLVVNYPSDKQEVFIRETTYINKYISTNYKCYSDIRNMNGDMIQNNNGGVLEDILNKGTNEAMGGKAIMNVIYEDNTVYGVLSYPFYFDDSYLGIININKSFETLYESYKKSIFTASAIEITVFALMLILTIAMSNTLIKPIIALTKGVQKVGQGVYDFDMPKISKKNEIGILTTEFINMKEKIREQIDTINKEKEKVETLQQGRVKFFNNVTHELKTPLTAISGYAEVIMNDMVTDEAFKKRALERIYSESERLHQLVLELIDISKGISNIEEEKKNMSIDIVLKQVCEDMKIKADKYNLYIESDIDEGTIYAQENRIKEVIINIIDNAIKYSEDEEKIVLQSQNDNKLYYIKVINRGGPIPDEIYEYIFEPFVKIEDNKNEKSRGLGLYICNEIIKGHNGEITIKNGEYIEVILKIPLVVNKLETTS